MKPWVESRLPEAGRVRPARERESSKQLNQPKAGQTESSCYLREAARAELPKGFRAKPDSYSTSRCRMGTVMFMFTAVLWFVLLILFCCPEALLGNMHLLSHCVLRVLVQKHISDLKMGYKR